MTTISMPGPVNTIAALSVFAMSSALAQAPDRAPSFEVASIKPGMPLTGSCQQPQCPGVHGGPGTSDPARIAYRALPLQYLVSLAYEVPGQRIDGPNWLSTERYDIEATLPPRTTNAQVKLMLRSLLAERFGLVLHRDAREVPALLLNVAKAGLKLETSKPQIEGASDSATATGARGPYGFSPVPSTVGAGGIPRINPMSGNTRLIVKNESMDDFAVLLAEELSRPVINETGVQGEFDIVLYYLDERALPPALAALRSEGSSPNNAPPLRSAI